MQSVNKTLTGCLYAIPHRRTKKTIIRTTTTPTKESGKTKEQTAYLTAAYLTFTPHSSNYPDDEYTDVPEESLTSTSPTSPNSKLRRDRIRAQRGQQKDRSSYLYKYAYLTTHPSPH
jgi:hypothetical protein